MKEGTGDKKKERERKEMSKEKRKIQKLV